MGAPGFEINDSAMPTAFSAPAGGITGTGALPLTPTIPNKRAFLTHLDFKNVSATGTEVVVTDGSGGPVLWRSQGASMITADPADFNPPLRSSMGNALFVACVTTASQTYVNAQGYMQ